MSKLIMCPGCDHVINENELINNTCPKCGLSFNDEELVKELEKIYLCPICGATYTNTDARNNEHVCKFCNKELIKINMTLKENTDFLIMDGTTVKDQTRILANKFGGFQFSEKAYENIMNIVNNKKQSTTQPSTPHCPTCNSTNIRKIGTGERAVSIIGLGLFSHKINKTWKCNDCGHTW